jgi:hypothetical protein
VKLKSLCKECYCDYEPQPNSHFCEMCEACCNNEEKPIDLDKAIHVWCPKIESKPIDKVHYSNNLDISLQEQDDYFCELPRIAAELYAVKLRHSGWDEIDKDILVEDDHGVVRCFKTCTYPILAYSAVVLKEEIVK